MFVSVRPYYDFVGQVKAGKSMLCHVRKGYDRLGQFRPGYGTLVQVGPC